LLILLNTEEIFYEKENIKRFLILICVYHIFLKSN